MNSFLISQNHYIHVVRSSWSEVVKSKKSANILGQIIFIFDLKPSTCFLIPSKTSCLLSIGKVNLFLSMCRDGVWVDRGDREERRFNTETCSISNPIESGNG